MFHSLQSRLIVVLALLLVATLIAGLTMVRLFQQSTAARVGQAQAEAARACDAIADSLRFYTAGTARNSETLAEPAFTAGLTAVVQTALRQRTGIEGGIWQRDRGSLAYAFPTYEGSGPKTDFPQAELSRIRDVNRSAQTGQRPVNSSYTAASQTLLLTACPLDGPIAATTAWTMTRVLTFAGKGYPQLMAGLVSLLLTVLAAAVLLMRLTLSWSHHIGRLESILTAHDVAELPVLPLTAERELDRLVTALNEAGLRLAEARRRSDELSREIATAERLAAIGRIAAGVAHEIRNPLAAMRLKAENALAGGSARHENALTVILAQTGRLERLARRLLNLTVREAPHLERIDMPVFLERCLDTVRDLAAKRAVTLVCRAEPVSADLDPEQMGRALENLLLNAIEAAPQETQVSLQARVSGQELFLAVQDLGKGPPESIRGQLFEPFVTGRPSGTGLGLSIVRDIVSAHGGTACCRVDDSGTTFEIRLPWRAS